MGAFVVGERAQRTGSRLRGGRSALPGADPEAKLIADAQHGSEQAVETLVRRHWPSAYRAAYLVVHDAAAAEDIAQESILAAVDALDRFDPKRPMAPWLNRIVVNNALKWIRRAAHRNEMSVETLPERPSHDAPEVSAGVLAALASLDADTRAVIVMRHLLECTPGEIATALGLPRGTVNSRLRRGLDRLAADLGEERG